MQIRIRKVGSSYLTSEDISIRYGKEIKFFDSENNLIPEGKIIEDNSTLLHADISRYLMHKPFVSEPIEYRAEAKYEITEYWDVCINENKDLKVQEKYLYLVQSMETIEVGKSVCAKMVMKTEELGIHTETHRAGFFDNGFLARATCELSNWYKPILLEHGQYLTRMFWEDTTHPASILYSGHYQGQEGPTPPKQFKNYKNLWSQEEFRS